MKCGDVLGIWTRKAPNHPRGRHKYHLYLCVDATHPNQHIFMFISTGGTEHCMRIEQSDWPKMAKSASHINCQELYTYSMAELKKAQNKGRLSDAALERLMNHAGECITLEIQDADIIIDAIRNYLNL